MAVITSVVELDTWLRNRLLPGDAPVFYEHWRRARGLLENKPIVAVYTRFDTRYANVAVLTPSLLVDVEGAETTGNAYHSVQRTSAIRQLILRDGADELVPGTAGARLSLLLRSEAAVVTTFWTAMTDTEVQALEEFAASLVKLLEES